MTCQTLIVGGRVVDGTGNPWFFADVALDNDRIVALAPPGAFPRESAAAVVDARGKVVCPGFIDIQSHSLTPLFSDGRALSKITQGVTSEILGELWTPAPSGGRRKPIDRAQAIAWGIPMDVVDEAPSWNRFSDWLARYERQGVSVNVGSFVGGGTVREFACGWEMGDPSPEQVETMRRVVADAMEDGAFGIAPALIYPPSSFSPDSELSACAQVVGRYGGVYIVHLRSEGDGLLESIDATARLSQEAHCPAEIYHLKASGERNWHRMPLAIERIEAWRAAGVDLTADMYPYTGSGTGLTVLVPTWASEGGRLLENLRDPATRAKIHAEMLAPESATGDFASADRGGHVMPVGFRQEKNRRFIGRRLTQIAQEVGRDWAETAIELLLSEEQSISTIFFSMCEENLRLQLRQPWIKVSTDAGGVDPAAQSNPLHPRSFGTYPRVLGKYVRDERVLPLEDAVRKMTSAVADRLRLKGRGQVREGFVADVVVFDPATVIDRATFAASNQLSVGIEEVWVNGVRVLQGGVHTGALPGRTLRPGV